MDIKGERIWKGSTTATENNLTNAAFLRTMILLIENFFAEGEISEIWITFPDPGRVCAISNGGSQALDSCRFTNVFETRYYVRLKTDNTGFMSLRWRKFCSVTISPI